ncbi:hypothetical protein, partial [Mycobacterium kiyosense]|uniref:hypothetical protein n=1 Tax=Mycobacterium kiyosense TaxID=2871094 RepID=UPI00222E7574
MSWVDRDGGRWQVGAAGDVAWIAEATTYGVTITSAIPPVFASYATVVAVDTREERQRHDDAVLTVLEQCSPDQRWWLG